MAPADRGSDLSQIAVNAHNIPDDSVDCGIRLLGWCRGPGCQKYARLRTFVIILACAGITQGACETYFRISAKQAALENDYDPIVVDWLLVSSGLFQAVFALAFAYWAHKLHPISWMGGVIMIQGVTSLVAIIPSIMNFSDGVVPAVQSTGSEVCKVSLIRPMAKSALTEEQTFTLTLVLLFVLQLSIGLGSLAFYNIGITYIDDNSLSIDSPAVIAATVGAKLFGLQVGSILILGVGATSVGWWLGWAILAPIIFVTGLMLSLFPRRLPKTVIHQAAQRIIEESRNRQFGSQFSTYIDDTNFGPSIKRLFGNKLLMFNLLSIMFIQAATINYMSQEEAYLQSRFFLPFSEEDGLEQEWRAHFVSYFLKPPVAAISMLIGGLVISKLKLSGRTISGINITLGTLLMGIYVAFIFIKCEVGPIGGTANGKVQQAYCSRQCICQPTQFLPVCPENSTVTYYSPCYAGCTIKSNINNVELYEGCTCGQGYDMHTAQNIRATEGSCSADTCFAMLVVFQVLSLLGASIYGMTAIGKILISLRSVLPQDKGLALAMEVMLFGLFAYIPVHLAYDVVTRTSCLYWAPEYERCVLRETPKHGNILNILTASLIFVGLFFDVLVFIFAKGLNLYNCKVTDVNYTPSLYSPVPREDPSPAVPAAIAVPAIGGSPATTSTNISPMQRRKSLPARAAPRPEITVFRNPSSVTTSSGEQSIDPNSGVTYAQVVFPPDKHKPNDGTTSPKRMAARADVPLHHLSAQDVRAQLGALKSFNPENKNTDPNIAITPLTTSPTTPAVATTTNATSSGASSKTAPIETDLDTVRPQSPETDF
ncbi:solute carrier organic anion transporter family member 1A2 [Teleopsis dalmanni]|uniref:solute carrier organic anion transporter family member 1A2 n=1 Tax=Teleopsis dalmanni TaxID=139649 RepID=UPI0018CC98E8|nr:solute carrier organic anion transporter family member 1A2 [Teleopsis dalmanni]